MAGGGGGEGVEEDQRLRGGDLESVKVRRVMSLGVKEEEEVRLFGATAAEGPVLLHSALKG